VVINTGSEASAADFMEILDNLPEKGLEYGSFHLATVLEGDSEPKQQLQSLPLDAVSLSDRPATKG
jgi:hypothetical protein